MTAIFVVVCGGRPRRPHRTRGPPPLLATTRPRAPGAGRWSAASKAKKTGDREIGREGDAGSKLEDSRR